jgi:hypothetical protein
VQVWEVRDEAARPLLRFSDEPGPIVGTDGSRASPRRHPFLSAVFLSANDEVRLRALLVRAVSTDDFVLRLRLEGYAVIRAGD